VTPQEAEDRGSVVLFTILQASALHGVAGVVGLFAMRRKSLPLAPSHNTTPADALCQATSSHEKYGMRSKLNFTYWCPKY